MSDDRGDAADDDGEFGDIEPDDMVDAEDDDSPDP